MAADDENGAWGVSQDPGCETAFLYPSQLTATACPRVGNLLSETSRRAGYDAAELLHCARSGVRLCSSTASRPASH